MGATCCGPRDKVLDLSEGQLSSLKHVSGNVTPARDLSAIGLNGKMIDFDDEPLTDKF
jgi:hypothetical protein